jgi:hypothetical protein
MNKMISETVLPLKYILCTRFGDGTVRYRIDLNQYGSYSFYQTEYNYALDGNNTILDKIKADCRKRELYLDMIIFKIDYFINNINIIMVGDIPQLKDVRYIDINPLQPNYFESLIYNKMTDELRNFTTNFTDYINNLYNYNGYYNCYSYNVVLVPQYEYQFANQNYENYY